jgi:hypothetical protein
MMSSGSTGNYMLKKYLPFFILQLTANSIWVFLVLPAVGEEGTLSETLRWLAIQIALPGFLAWLLIRGRRYALWLLIIYASLILLFGLGMVGWALMGEATPWTVYAVCLLFFVVGFGILFYALKDLNIGQKPRQYGLDE